MKEEFRKILKFAWFPTKTNQGWIWLQPYICSQKLGQRYVLVPECKGWYVPYWWTMSKDIIL